MKHDLSELWGRIRDGDHRAWGTLVSEYASLVYAVARRVGLDRPDAEDCAQWAWLSLYRQRHKIRDPLCIPAWLIRTTHRRAVRLAERLGQPALAPEPDALALQPDTDQVELAEFRRDLPLALKQLDPKCRQLVESLFLDSPEKSYREAAAILGLDPDTVGPMRSRCLGRLRKILEKMGWDLH